MWERELRKIKGLYDNRLRASQQKSSKMEQALTNQTYQVNKWMNVDFRGQENWIMHQMLRRGIFLENGLTPQMGIMKIG